MLRVSTLILFATVFATLLPRKKHMLRSRGISPVACFDKNFPLAATKRRVASFFGRSSAQEIESTRLGFFVKQTRNQRNSIERGMYTFARVLSRGRFFFFLVWPNRDAREPFHGRKFNFCHFARARNTTLSGSFPFRRSESRFHDEFTCIPTHDLKRTCRVTPRFRHFSHSLPFKANMARLPRAHVLPGKFQSVRFLIGDGKERCEQP